MKILNVVAFVLMIITGPLLASDLPTVRLAVLKIGTVNWELATIKANGFDEKHGFKLKETRWIESVSFKSGSADRYRARRAGE